MTKKILSNIEPDEVLIDFKDDNYHTLLSNAVKNMDVISIKTYDFNDKDRENIRVFIMFLMKSLNKDKLSDIVFCYVDELVMNAVKKNFKRLYFINNNINYYNEEEYKKFSKNFLKDYKEGLIHYSEEELTKNNYFVVVTFYFSYNVLNIKIKNNFLLTDFEDRMLREHFSKSESISELLSYYISDFDPSVNRFLSKSGLLLHNIGIDKHSFTVYSSNKYNETIAKLELPLSKKYIGKRKKFILELKDKNLSPEELRKNFDYNYRKFEMENKKGV